MPKGRKLKPSFVKANEKPRHPEESVTDDLSTVDKGHDFVKAGESAQIGR